MTALLDQVRDLDFSRRAAGPERIDDPSLSVATLSPVWRDLRVINRWLGGDRTTLGGLARLLPPDPSAAGPGGTRVRVLDVGAGAGDSAAAIVGWGRARGYPIELVALDWAAGGLQASRGFRDRILQPVRADAAALPFADASFDVATAALLLHHLDGDGAARVVDEMLRVSRRGIVINDLQRSRVAWASIWLLTRLFPACPIVRHDAPLSVRRGFTRAELSELLNPLGGTVEIRWRWAFRYQIVIRKQAGVGR